MKGIQGTSNKTYRQLMGNGLRYEIPKFQRDYTWEEEQWDDLWNDALSIFSNEEEEHYLGYLVLQTSNNKEFQIIDGQQRLTTLSILILAVLKCLDNLVKQNIDPDKNKRRQESLLNSYIGYIDPVTLISNNKLKLNRNSDDYYKRHLVLLGDLPLRNINASEKHMRGCFLWFYDSVNKQFKSGEALAGFVDSIVDKLFFTVIEVTDQLNAFKVFETLNARGVQLSAADLLKNYFFSIIDEAESTRTEIEELEGIWSQINGKLGEQKFEDFLRYFWNSRNRVVGKKALFKTIKNTVVSKEHVFRLVRELNSMVDVFLAIQNPNDDLWKDRPELRKSLHELKLFKIKQVFSLLLAGYSKLPHPAFDALVRACSIISFRYNVISSLNPNNQENTYNDAALRINENPAGWNLSLLKGVYVNDDTFKNAFEHKEFKNTTPNMKIVKYILTKIERSEYGNDIDHESDLFTIEHVLPENPNDYWEHFESADRFVNRLGNLTLLEKHLNREAGNAAYADKKSILLKSSSKLTRAIPEHYDQWTKEKIGSRQNQLSKAAKSIWRIQELED